MRLVSAISLLAGLLPIGALADGLQHVKQTIYGMDCAPCAYGVEQGLKGLSGVEQVTVSLNDGYAEVRLGNDSQTTLTEIRDIIRKNGFTPKDADVHVSGIVVQANDGAFLLKTDAETFELNTNDQSILSQLSADLSATVSGSVPTGNPQQLSVTRLSSRGQ